MNPLDRGHELARQRALSATARKKDDEKNADRHAQQAQNDKAYFAALVFEIAHCVAPSLARWRGHVDLCSPAVEEFAAKEKQRNGNQDYENDEHGDDAGTRSTTF
jgi:hypothetical protein